jgi:hypothetical protein
MFNHKFLAKFLVALLMIPLFSLLLIGCNLFCNSASCCGEKFATKFEVTGLKLSGLLELSSAQNYVQGSLLAENQTVQFDKLAIQIQSIIRNFSFNNESNSGNYFSSAYACSPPEPEPVEQIANIEIYADKDFDDNHPKGSNLSDLFEIVLEGDYWNQIQYPIKLADFLPQKPKTTYLFTLLLKSPPKSIGSYKFNIKYTQTNNEKFEVGAYPINLTF